MGLIFFAANYTNFTNGLLSKINTTDPGDAVSV